MARRTTVAVAARQDSGVVALPVAHPAPAPRRAPRPRRDPKPIGVVGQVRMAFRARNWLAALVGILVGGIVPLASYWLAHYELDRSADLWAQSTAWLVLGGLCFSFPTVYGWARRAFAHPVKAVGFVVLLEGILLSSRTPWLALTALAFLMAINAIATACRLADAG